MISESTINLDHVFTFSSSSPQKGQYGSDLTLLKRLLMLSTDTSLYIVRHPTPARHRRGFESTYSALHSLHPSLSRKVVTFAKRLMAQCGGSSATATISDSSLTIAPPVAVVHPYSMDVEGKP
ncbi:hypothetical protein BCR41DRAFT_344851 [Lobosporangium transversale]|uniref:Uncharacterized protein n=1 Tax=Lobosporangium transversale TaxID=64571 RepID=A0A1Y2H0Z4_9FUNG|nr:hypothetical protein BCR41DRAFT_344851 [Lobosporangium transversale]ORZ28218.1 hypothetical protein BCR41DRAFT_344851 [Lobosporangium transversale]|eukprot:XP_021885903.1 hypothetical protein BCR41DRAFT_344851 [Lobosporangium transversale]